MRPAPFLAAAALAVSITGALAQDTTNFPALGTVHRLDPRLDELLPKEAKIEVIGSGFTWCEGPTWFTDASDPDGGYLLFSEIPSNSVRKWTAKEGVSIFLTPSGFTGRGYYSKEPGSNGLLGTKAGSLISCEHGDRRISILKPGMGKKTLADNCEGKRFNSPNDLTVKSNGDIYFTDPPYGLPEQADDKSRDMDYCGVWRISAADGTVTLLSKALKRPNGIAFSPDEKTLYVAQSDKVAIWMAFNVRPDGTLDEGRVWKDVSARPGEKPMKGAPDGMKVDEKGNLWASGPGGLLIMSPDGTLLGRLETGEATSNCAFGGPDGTTLFITADMYICRIQTKVKGAGR